MHSKSLEWPWLIWVEILHANLHVFPTQFSSKLFLMDLLKSSHCMSPPSEVKMGYSPIHLQMQAQLKGKMEVNSDILLLQKRSMRIRSQGFTTSLSIFRSDGDKLWGVKLWPCKYHNTCLLTLKHISLLSPAFCIRYTLTGIWKFLNQGLHTSVWYFKWLSLYGHPQRLYVIW